MLPFSDYLKEESLKIKKPCCMVCQEEYDSVSREPKVLGCGHSVCNSCLTQILQMNRQCPTCRAIISISVTVPRNYQLNDTLETIEQLEAEVKRLKESAVKKPENGRNCSECDGYVSENKMSVCQDCLMTIYHSDIEDIPLNPELVISDVAICSDCALLGHVQKKHTTVPFFPILAAKQFSEYLPTIKQTRDNFDDDLNRMDDLYNIIRSNIDIFNTNLNKMTQMVQKSRSSKYQRDFMSHFEREVEQMTQVLLEVRNDLETKNLYITELLDTFTNTVLCEAVQKCDIDDETPETSEENEEEENIPDDTGTIFETRLIVDRDYTGHNDMTFHGNEMDNFEADEVCGSDSSEDDEEVSFRL